MTMKRPAGGFLRPFLALFGVGLVGVVALVPMVAPQLRAVLGTVGAPELPYAAALALALGQVVLLTAVSVAVGTLLAPRVGLYSHLAAAAGGRPRERSLRAELPTALVGAVIAGVMLVAYDVLTMPLMGPAWQEVAASQPRTVAVTVAGALYGGITEELLVRWGLLTLLTWLPWRLLRRGRGVPGPGILWPAIIVTAVVFGFGHLGYAATLIELTPVVVARIVVGNALGGVIFGWLFWRRSLEAAMIAHGGSHVIISLIAWSGLIG